MNALLINAKGRGKNQTPSGYTRILGNERLGNLISKLQGTVISAGKELENLIWEFSTKTEDLDKYLNMDIYHIGIYVVRKEQI